MDCPVHGEPLRIEYARNAPGGEPWATGFCLKCLRHYPCCMSTCAMRSCDLIEGHVLPHRSQTERSPVYMWTDPIPWKERN